MSAAVKSPAVVEVPPLDAIVNAPDLAQLPFETLTALRVKCAATLAAIESAQLVAVNRPDRKIIDIADDQMLTVAEACGLLRCQPRFIWRNKKKLPFVRVLGPRSLRCSRQGIESWLSARKAR